MRPFVQLVRDLKIEALRLYDPLPFQEEYHRCRAKELIMAKGTQVGGSLAGYIEVARAVTNQDPYDKYPKKGVAVCLGYGEGHIGRVIHRYLFRWGAFKIIEDLDTKEMRTFRPWKPDMLVNGKPGDGGREDEAKPAPPLIPPRFIKGKPAWLKRSQNIFSQVEFTTGWELYAFNSQGDPSMGQGFQVDLYDIDEDLATGGWYAEAVSRTAIPKGIIRWHALPHAKTEDIVQMLERAAGDIGKEKPMTVAIQVTMHDNPYFPDESKIAQEKIFRSMGEEVYRQRVLGLLSLDSSRVYPTFSEYTHNAMPKLSAVEQMWEAEGKQQRTLCQKVLTERNGEPPIDWCRYMTLDPGHQVCAVLFFAVPPPGIFGTFKILYDELYILQATAALFGERVEERVRNRHFQDFIIDAHGARLREIGSGVLPRRQYEKELEQRKIYCEARGPRFLNGSDDVEGREMAVRKLLETRTSANPQENGFPTFLVISERCPNFIREMRVFRKQIVKIGGRDVVTDKANRRANTHAIEAFEYGAAHGMAYVSPPKRQVQIKSYADTIRDGVALRELRRRAKNGLFGFRNINLGPRGDG